MAIIQDRDATVKTAVVEIKALTVNGKQVSLAMFRQIESESILEEETFRLRGEAWGRVNYHCDDCKNQPRHLHILWQKGSELRRCWIYQDRMEYKLRELRDRSRVLRLSAFLVAARESEPTIGQDNLGSIWKSLRCDADHVVSASGIQVKLSWYNTQCLYEYWRSRRGGSIVNGESWLSTLEGNIMRSPDGTHSNRGYQSKSCEQWLYESRRVDGQAKALERSWSAAYGYLESLDQLFIAI